jgi:NAD(P)-dependent dehydrogenase (short-subunit alcohol dehydrogenase family)
MAGELEGKRAIVTGAARGIGRAFVLGLAGAGCSVAAADLDAAGAEETAELARRARRDALGLSVDVARAESVDRMIESVLSRWSGLDILVNDAGVFPRATVLEMDEATWDRVIAVNLKGTYLCSKAGAQVMVAQGRGGRIVSMVSRAAYTAYPRGAHYAASKAGILAFTRSLASELGPHGITVNALSPGTVNTAMPRAAGVSDEQLFASGRTYPLGRIAEPLDLVPALLFLCGDGGAYMTGQVIHVNGGSFMP